jgi:hypothetical protein
VSKLKAIIDSGRKAGIEAYHGSPYDFPAERELQFDDPRDVPIFDQDISIFDGRAYQPIDAPVPEGARVIQEFPLGRFDSSKIGTGEGAQAYGRGSYLAESEDLARGYRDQLKGNVVIRDDGVKLPYAKHVSEIETAIKNKFPKLAPDNVRMTAKSVVNDNLVPADVEGMGVFDSTGYKAEDIYLEGIRANKGARASKGSMYKVNIDADPDELIDWDELIDEQPKKIMDKLKGADWWPYAEEGIYDIAGARGENPTGADLVRWLEQDGQDYAAEALEDLGIKGVKYADSFTRHKPKDKRSNNYVIFDPRIIEISKKYGISIPAAYAMIQSEDAEAGMYDLGLKIAREGVDLAEKAPAQFNRGTRNMAKRVFLSPQERSAIEASLGGDSELAINIARDWKKRHPNSDWAQPNITGAKLTKDKKVELKFKSMPYAYNIDPKTGKQVKPGSAQFKKISDGVADEVIDYFKRAENPDDLSARNVINNAGWYKNVERRLRTEYGSFSEMMGDLLGATSPNTPVATNFRFTKDILDGFARGEFDELMEGFADSLDKRYALEDQAAAFLEAEKATGRKAKDIKEDPAYTALIDESKNIAKELRDKRNIIKQRNGKQFGINSYNAMVALADKFRIRRVGSAPKAKNFAGNLVGSSQEATIDVWSARNLRRHSGRKPIPSSAEKGVTGKIVDPENFVSNLEFGFGQDVIRDATDKINQFIGPEHPLYPLDPRDVQALQWFAEKDLWTRKGWTSKAGEGGSFEQMLDADPVESLVLGLSREQSMENQGRDFVPTSDQMLESMATILKPASTDPDVVTYKGLPTGGAYMGTPETALDVNIVSREDFIPVDTLDLAAAQAAEDLQQSWFVARRIKDDLGASRPEMFTVGTEIYFDGPKLANNNLIQDISDYLLNNDIPAYTMIVDPRDANSVIGLRVLDIPQLSGDSKKYATMSTDEYKDTVGRSYGQFETLGRNLEEAFGQIKSATPAYFDVNIKSLADTQDYLGQYGKAARDPDALRQEFYGFKPAQERFRQWEGQSLPYYRKYKAPDSKGGKKSEGLDGLGFNDKSPKALGAGITGLGATAVLSSEDAEAGGLGVKSRRMPDDVALKAAPKKESPGLPSLVGQLGLGAMSEIAGTILGGAAGVDEYLRGSPTESIRDAREGTSEFVGGLYDAGPEAQQLGQEAVKGIAGIVGPTIDYAMEGPVMDERGLNVLPLIAKALNMSYEGWKEIYDLLPEREQEAVISAADAFL